MKLVRKRTYHLWVYDELGEVVASSFIRASTCLGLMTCNTMCSVGNSLGDSSCIASSIDTCSKDFPLMDTNWSARL